MFISILFLYIKVANSTVKCKYKIPGSCEKEIYCNGQSQQCPNEYEYEPDGTICGDQGMLNRLSLQALTNH